ncbi:MAG TPA: VIT1/CCC1 transporter family protein [Candidatus Udaeobacter sp.]|jgi:VIT1/CCC1 family predicted Fe2+/Mn2+ transporter/rubrerythrin|nr:VIT1/CCC1 transporter family protein [Candidatus Udaeobacter sp.]
MMKSENRSGDGRDRQLGLASGGSRPEETIEVVKRNWRAEIETAQTYRDLAKREPNEKRKGILLRMAEAEERHAQRWEKKLRDLGVEPPVLEDTFGRRLNRWWNKIAGANIAIRRMEAAEKRHEAEFREQADRALAGEPDVQEFLRQSALEEKAHARALNAMTGPPSPRTALDAILKRERWHGRGGSWVADAIYGANDGLGAVFGIVSGVAGATSNQQHYILIAGLAGTIASTLSMGAGAYLAAKSEAEVYEAEMSRERTEVEENPEEEIEEMSLFYQLQGFSPEESQKMAERLAQQPEQFVQAMAQSELGLSEHRFPNQWTAAFSAGISTAIGAFIPIIPFFFSGGVEAVIISFGISLVAHFAVGALKSLITIRSWWASGLEMTWIGVIVAVVTYGLGLAFGALG